MKAGALTGWFKSVFHRPPPARPDDDDDWDAAIAAARARLAAARAGDDADDWDTVIARAKMRATSQQTRRPPPPPPARRASPQAPHAKLDAMLRAGLKRPAAPLTSFAIRRPAPEDLPTPLPLGMTRRTAGPLAGAAKRP
jgi:hypothetical protein